MGKSAMTPQAMTQAARSLAPALSDDARAACSALLQQHSGRNPDAQSCGRDPNYPAARACSVSMATDHAPDSLFGRIFYGKPVSTFPENALAIAVLQLSIAVADIALKALESLQAGVHELTVFLFAAGRQRAALDRGVVTSQRVGPIRAGAGQRAVDIADVAHARGVIGQARRHRLPTERSAAGIESCAADRDIRAGLLIGACRSWLRKGGRDAESQHRRC